MLITRFITTAVVTAVASVVMPSVPVLAAGGVRLSVIQYDSPGADTGSNHSLNAEWVKLTNHGDNRRTLTGWTLRDPDGHAFHFPSFKLRAGRSVRIHTGKGNNTSTDLYWGSSYYVWNNGGDKATLRNAAGDKIDACSWSSLGDGTVHC